MILTIDTSDQKIVRVSLKREDGVVSKEDTNQFGSQILLPLIDSLLKSQELSLSDIREIEVATGPGSYTGLRVGVAVANALAYSLSIPVNGKEMETTLEYGKKT